MTEGWNRQREGRSGVRKPWISTVCPSTVRSAVLRSIRARSSWSGWGRGRARQMPEMSQLEWEIVLEIVRNRDVRRDSETKHRQIAVTRES